MTLTGILSAIDDSVGDAAYNMGASAVTFSAPSHCRCQCRALSVQCRLCSFSRWRILQTLLSSQAIIPHCLWRPTGFVTGMFGYEWSAVLALFLLLPTLAAYLIQRYWISNKSFVTVGKPTQRRKLYEPYIVWPLFAFCSLFSLRWWYCTEQFSEAPCLNMGC